MKRLARTDLRLLLCTSAWAQNAYTFQTINYPNDTFTQLLGINNSNRIAGYHNFDSNSGFTLGAAPRFHHRELSSLRHDPGHRHRRWHGRRAPLLLEQQWDHPWFLQKHPGHADLRRLSRFGDNQLLGQNEMAQAAGYYSMSVDNTTPDFPYIYDEWRGVFFR